MELLFLIAFLSTGALMFGVLEMWEKYLQRQEAVYVVPEKPSRVLVRRFLEEQQRLEKEQTRFLSKKRT